MNEPKTPNNSRDWESIDIYLFSNGQQYSPPRKYHLQADDLNWWDATKKFLARSQFGSMHSTIELYTLDGKKIEGPLELKNSAAYVAVEPPDSFISAGYEKYLIKASRSCEKRQDRLTNKEDKTDEDKAAMDLDFITIEQVQGIIALSTVLEDPNIEPIKLTTSQKNLDYPTDSKENSTKNKIYSNYRKNVANSENNIIRKKDTCCTPRINNNGLTPFKRKNVPSVKNFKNKNNKQSASPQNSKISTKPVSKIRPGYKDDVLKDTEKDFKLNNRKMNPNKSNKTEQILDKNGKAIVKIPSPDLQSIYTEADRELTDIDNSKVPREMSKQNLLDKVANISEKDKPLCNLSHEVQNNEKKLNIKLRIKLEDCSNKLYTEIDPNLAKKTSIMTLIKEEKASQVNIDVILSRDLFTLNNHLILNEKSDTRNYNDEYIRNAFNNKVDSVCDNVSRYSNTSNGLCFHKFGSNELLLLSNAINERITESCKCNQMIIETADIGIQSSFISDNTLLKSTNKINKENNESNEITPQGKYPFKLYSNIVSEDQNNTEPAMESLVSPKTFTDRYVQTEWSNILLLAKCHADGRYTFHLPSLPLLKQYNINQIYLIYYLFYSSHCTYHA